VLWNRPDRDDRPESWSTMPPAFRVVDVARIIRGSMTLA
jgi:hypothetical protein